MPKPIGMFAQGVIAPVCAGRHSRRIPALCPRADPGTQSVSCGENCWSQHTNRGDRVSASVLDVAKVLVLLQLVHSQVYPPGAWGRGPAHSILFLMGCFPGSSEHVQAAVSTIRLKEPDGNGQTLRRALPVPHFLSSSSCLWELVWQMHP